MGPGGVKATVRAECVRIGVATVLLVTSLVAAAQGSDPVAAITSALRARQFDRALELLEPALQQNPKSAQLWTLEGISFSGKSNKNAALAEANTRFDQDGQDGGANIPDPSAYFSYYGDANYDVRHRFSFSGLYSIPGVKSGIGRVLTDGWEVSAIVAVQTGTPFWVIDNRPADVMCNQGGTPTPCSSAAAGSPVITPNILAPDSGDYNLDGNNYDIPLAATQNFTGGHSRSAYINGLFTVSDFGQPTLGSEGTEPRNIYRNPGMFQADASLFKNNRLPWVGEQGNLQFRFDFLNLFNHGNLGTVDPNMADGTFGKVTGTLNPYDAKKIELGLRISF
jgi:hypothetical protein